MVILKLHDITVTPTQVIPFAVDEETTYRTHKYNGDDTLRFEIQRNHELYQKIFEEVKIEGFGNRFLVKQIDEHSDFVTVDCSLDYDEWKNIIFKDYRKTNEIISNIINEILPTGWSVVYGTGVDQTKRTTVEESEGEAFRATVALSILDAVMAAYDVVCNFDIIEKVLYIINPESYTPSGEFIMEDLNLTELGFNGDSNDFITRLYPYGKKDETTGQYVNIKSVNDNKEYIDNFQYSNKVVCGTWVDERYTVPQNLYDDAAKKLEELSRPQRSYTCNVINFNEDIWLYKVVTLIDKNKGQRANHQVIEFVEYKNHKLDNCTLASKAPSITSIVQETTRSIDGKIEQIKSGIQQVIDEKTQQLSDTITGSNGGHFKWILDADGNMEELVNLYDSEDITRAQKVWRWNAGGLGHSNNGYNGTYGLALTKDGEINASMITTGILNAGVIRAGTIQDVRGNNSWNLENGTFAMRSGSITLGTKFSVNSNGEATLVNATFNDGTITTTGTGTIGGQTHNKELVIGSAIMEGYDNGFLTGILDLAATYTSGKHVSLRSEGVLHLQSGNPASGGKEITIDSNGLDAGGTSGTFSNSFISLTVKKGIVTSASVSSVPTIPSGVSGTIVVDNYAITLDDGIVVDVQDLQE